MSNQLRDKVDQRLGDLCSGCYLFLKSSFNRDPRAMLAYYRHYCMSYDHQLSKGKDRETEWLRAKNDFMEILLVLKEFKEEILGTCKPTGLQWFSREIDFFKSVDVDKLIEDICQQQIKSPPAKKDELSSRLNKSKKKFIQYLEAHSSLTEGAIRTWMESAFDQSQFTISLAKEMISQWEKEDPSVYGDPYGIWGILSRKAEYEFLGRL